MSPQSARRLRWSVKTDAVNQSSGNATALTTAATTLTRSTAVGSTDRPSDAQTD